MSDRPASFAARRQPAFSVAALVLPLVILANLAAPLLPLPATGEVVDSAAAAPALGDQPPRESGWQPAYGRLPLQFEAGENAESLGLDGTETFTIKGVAEIKPRQDVEIEVRKADGSVSYFTARCRIDTYNELEYFKSGGILHYVLRKLAAA